MLCLSHYCLIKLEKRAEQVLPGSEKGGRGEGRVEGKGNKWHKHVYT
jgi:hypothetical protein